MTTVLISVLLLGWFLTSFLGTYAYFADQKN